MRGKELKSINGTYSEITSAYLFNKKHDKPQLQVSVSSPGNPWSQSERVKERIKGRLRLEGFAEKQGFKSGMKERRGDG